MQPNNFNQNQTPYQPGTNGLQPSTYYEYSQPAQPTPPVPAAKSNPLSTILAIVFGITTIALGGLIAYDKLVANKSEIPVDDNSVIALSTPLSKVDAANYTKALTGRVFTVDGSFEQTIKFTSATEYEYSYYQNPATDIANFDLSLKHGSYTINGTEINLDSNDSFIITNDYLVKKSDKLSKNTATVYFDSIQLQNTYTSITKALKSKLSSWGGDASYKASKAYLSHLSCSTNSKRLTNADNYICNTDFDLYFDAKSVEKTLAEQKVANWATLCHNFAGLKFYNGNCGANNSIAISRNLVVRISNDDNYSITGIWTDAEAATSAKDDDTSEKSTN